MTTRKAKTIDVTDYMRKVCQGAGLQLDFKERVILPVSLFRKARKLLRLDDYLPDQEAQDGRPNDTQD